MQKNVASQTWTVFAFDRTDNTPKTGDAAQITAKIKIDGGAAGASDDANPTEIEDGYYEFTLTQAETNGNKITIFPESSTGDIQVIGVPGVVYTTPEYFADLGIESDGDLTKVNTLHGHTAQTSDHTAEIAKIPKSDSNVTWNATALASINAEVDTALNTAIPGAPTAASINDYIVRIKYATCNRWDITEATGNLEIFDDAGGSFATIAAAFSTLAGVTKRSKIL